MKHLALLVFVFAVFSGTSQTQTFEQPPVFPECKSLPQSKWRICFKEQLHERILSTFDLPDEVVSDDYSGEVAVLFEVNAEGEFEVIYVDAAYESLKSAAQDAFKSLPAIQPASYNGRPIPKQYSLKIPIPLPGLNVQDSIQTEAEDAALSPLVQARNELDSINRSIKPYEGNRYSSTVNIPFTHQYYSRFDQAMNAVGTNAHTAFKPFSYNDVSRYYDLEMADQALMKTRNIYGGRKLWNEHLVQFQSDRYWVTLDPVLDLQAGRDSNADLNSTYNNTRGFYLQGGLGQRLSFAAGVYESQGRFADYFNRYSESLKAFGPDPAIIPGRGIAKRFKSDAYDYPVAEGYLSYTPVDFLNIQFGHGKNFIGDGYRSLLLSDVASPSPYLRLSTSFWKIRYTNTWMWLKDVRPEVTEDGAFLSKYIANHYLSWNVSKRLNIGLFESIMWTNSNDRGFDVNYLNPVIFYRFIEFETGQGAGNAIVGATGKFKWRDDLYAYGQFILDEFSINDIKAGDKSWKNKYGYQIGLKYFNAFRVKNLLLQFEYNRVRPYTYSHNTIVLNYGHNNQSMAHLWGANFSEAVFIGRYRYQRWFGDAKLIIGKRGLDFNTTEDAFSYGGDIYRNYNERPADTGINLGQGNTTNVVHAELQGGYLVNPTTNLKLFAYLSYRNFDPQAVTTSAFKDDTVWFSLGLRTDLFNWYFDF